MSGREMIAEARRARYRVVDRAREWQAVLDAEGTTQREAEAYSALLLARSEVNGKRGGGSR